MYVSYAGATKVTIIDCDNGNIPWHSAGSNVDITLKNTDIGLTSSDKPMRYPRERWMSLISCLIWGGRSCRLRPKVVVLGIGA